MNNSNFETVEELVKRANVSYAEAKEALETCEWDMTEAMILLEKQGKLGSAANNQNTFGSNAGAAFKKTAENCASELKSAVQKGNVTYFEMMHEGKVVFSIPVTAAIVIGILCINLVIPAAVIALLCGCSFHIRKPDECVSAQFTSYQPWTSDGSAQNTASGSGTSNINLEK